MPIFSLDLSRVGGCGVIRVEACRPIVAIAEHFRRAALGCQPLAHAMPVLPSYYFDGV